MRERSTPLAVFWLCLARQSSQLNTLLKRDSNEAYKIAVSPGVSWEISVIFWATYSKIVLEL